MQKSWNFSFSGFGEFFHVPYSGTYQIECWGAQGGGIQRSGNPNAGFGGKGGYASGFIILTKSDALFVFVGSEGKSSDTALAEGGFNGGGYAFAQNNLDPGNAGGGASDVRLEGGSWDSPSGLLSRIIVAGGGGGGGEDGELGGYGGGLTGGFSRCHDTSCASNSRGGSFGKGAHTQSQGGGGGGGWIGGNTAFGSSSIPTSSITDDAEGGDGGSGFVFSEGVGMYPGYSVPNKYKMFNTSLIGDQRERDGFIRITLISTNKQMNSCNKSNITFIASFFFLSITTSILFPLK